MWYITFHDNTTVKYGSKLNKIHTSKTINEIIHIEFSILRSKRKRSVIPSGVED